MSFSFAVLLLFTIASAFVVVSSRNIVHAALALAFCFFGVAGFYLLLDAPFIAGAQVLIYVGAITVLILFAIMLTAQTAGLRDPGRGGRVPPGGRADGAFGWRLVAGSVALALFGGILLPAIRMAAWPPPAVAAAPAPELISDSLHALSLGLLQTYLLPFEIASVLLLAALIGAIVLAKEERSEEAE